MNAMPDPRLPSGPAARPGFSVVVPCFNEEPALPRLFAELLPALEKAAGDDWEVVLVDDGSSDRTWQLIREAAAAEGRITGVRLSRNFGHQPALMEGLKRATGRTIGIIDCDLQDPVEVLVQLHAKVASGECDVCVGQRRNRDAPLPLRAAYALFYRLIRRFAEHEWPIDAGDFSVFDRRVLDVILQCRESTPVLRGLRSWAGFRQSAIPYDRPARVAGTTKYGLWKLMMLAMHSFVSFSTLPLRIATAIGLVMTGFTILVGLLFTVNRFHPEFTLFGYFVGTTPGTTTLALYISLLASMLFFCIGILGEYIAVITREVKRRPVAVVAEALVSDGPPPAAPGTPPSGAGSAP